MVAGVGMSPDRFLAERIFERRRNLVRLAALPARVALALVLLSGTWPGLADAQVISPVPEYVDPYPFMKEYELR
jgi:hypothetical protein